MAATSKPSRRSRKSEPEDEIDLNYYANNPTLQGMLSHLKPELQDLTTPERVSGERTSPEAIVPVVIEGSKAGEVTSREDTVQHSSLEDLTVGIIQHDKQQDVISAREATTDPSAPDIAEAVVSVAEDIEHEETAAADTELPGLGRRRVIYVGNRAQMAHSALEHQFYLWAWRHATPMDEDRRRLTGAPAKISVIARELNVTERSTIDLLRRMVDKLALEVCEGWVHGKQEGKSYFIYSLRKIVERRSRVGLEYAIKGKGVILITEAEARALEASKRPPVLEDYGDAQPPVV